MGMTEQEGNPLSERRARIEAVVASTIGTTIEWYDFFLYGTAAALVFPKLFFPEFVPAVGQILAFGTYGVGFLARPLGGAWFGYLGDRVGRKSTLVATLLLMGVSTVLIGLLPTYDQIGIAAPIGLTCLRFLQGFGVGGEWGGAVLLALEHSQRGKRGFIASWPQTGVPLGLFLSTVVVASMERILSPEDFITWGWRVPFLLSALLIGIGFVIRARVLETPLFRQLQATHQVAQSPIRETLRRYWREVLLAAGARMGENASFYLFTAYIISYTRNVLELEAGLVLRAVEAAAVLEFVAIPIFGMVSDYWSRRSMYLTGCVLLMLFAFPYFALLDTKESAPVVTTIILSLGFGHAILCSVQGTLIAELFGTRVRYTGASLGFQLGAPLAGGLAPLIAASLVRAFPHHYWPLASYVVMVAMVSFLSVYFLAETSHKELSSND